MHDNCSLILYLTFRDDFRKTYKEENPDSVGAKLVRYYVLLDISNVMYDCCDVLCMNLILTCLFLNLSSGC